MGKVEYIAPSWEEIYKLQLELAKKIVDDNYKPDLIVGIARGGWIVARILSDLLGIKEIGNIRVEFYEDVLLTRAQPCITQEVSVDVRGKRVLLCDDVADTGKSLKVAADYLKSKGVSELKISTLHMKPKSVVRPDYYVSKTEAWIIYPWEIFETVKSIVGKLEKEGKNLEEIRKELMRTKIRPDYIQYFMDWMKTMEKYSSCKK
ncbi:MAG: phosphoribosyltransferase [Candidatus Jordarchaeaceae archaeon]